MGDVEGARMEMQLARDFAAGMGGDAAIFAVADDRRADGAGMGANLMRAAGQRHEGDPGEFGRDAGDDRIMRDGILCVFIAAFGRRDAFGARPALLGQRQIDRALQRRGRADGQRPVDLARILLLEGAGQRRGGARRARQHDDARGVAVEPVHQTRAFGRLECERVEHAVEMAFGFCAALYSKPGRLVEHQHRLVLVDDQRTDEGRVLVAQGPFGLRRGLFDLLAERRHTHRLAGREPCIGLRPRAVDPHLAGAQQFFEPAMGQRRIMPLEPAVEPNAVFVGGNADLRDFLHAENNMREIHRPANSAPTAPATEPAM